MRTYSPGMSAWMSYREWLLDVLDHRTAERAPRLTQAQGEQDCGRWPLPAAPVASGPSSDGAMPGRRRNARIKTESL